MCRRMKPLKKCRATGSLAMMSNSDVGLRLLYSPGKRPASVKVARPESSMGVASVTFLAPRRLCASLHCNDLQFAMPISPFTIALLDRDFTPGNTRGVHPMIKGVHAMFYSSQADE